MCENCTHRKVRKVDQEVASLRGRLGVLTRDGRHEEAAEVRHMLEAARKRVAMRQALADPPPLTREFADVLIGQIELAVCDV
jgi:hypothetical protein